MLALTVNKARWSKSLKKKVRVSNILLGSFILSWPFWLLLLNFIPRLHYPLLVLLKMRHRDHLGTLENADSEGLKQGLMVFISSKIPGDWCFWFQSTLSIEDLRWHQQELKISILEKKANEMSWRRLVVICLLAYKQLKKKRKLTKFSSKRIFYRYS